MKKKVIPLTQIFDNQHLLSNLFPESGKILLTGGGKDFVERLGIEAIRKAIFHVLSGENIRTQTEPLSRRRITQVSGAVVAMFAKGYATVDNFRDELSKLAITQLKTTRSNRDVWPAQWVIGLTGKLMQNVLRGNADELESYVKEFETAVRDAAKHCYEQLGDHKMTLGYVEDGQGKQVTLDWEGIARLTTAIGAQTLAIRGSDKSMYGKLFERLILGSVLTLFGFKRVDPKNNRETQGVFWLSDSSDNRESDATVIITPGKLARFDIGFIGSGNSEISKDKLSRYANTVESESGVSSSSVTFIVVDKLPTTGKTQAAAKKIGAEIIQMSMQYWPRELGNKLHERFGFTHEMLDLTDHELHTYIQERLDRIAVQEFLSGIIVAEATEETELDNADILQDEEE